MTRPSMLILTLISLLVSGHCLAQTPNISFYQDDTIQLKKGKKDYYEINLAKAPFDIVFEGNELHVCAGLSEELFQFAKADTDINADFNSYFFIFKYLAGSEDSDFLSIEKDTGNSLNTTHGAKPTEQEGLSKYTVRTLMNDGDITPLSEFKKLFLALWLDKNKDQYIDEPELIWVKATLK